MNHSGMETSMQYFKSYSPQNRLRENHSGMETVLPVPASRVLGELRENHSGMETVLGEAFPAAELKCCVRTIVVWKRMVFPYHLQVQAFQLRENHSGMETVLRNIALVLFEV